MNFIDNDFLTKIPQTLEGNLVFFNSEELTTKKSFCSDTVEFIEF